MTKVWARPAEHPLASVAVTLDGKPLAQAVYGLPYEGLVQDWPQSNDPLHPNVGFQAAINLRGASVGPGAHWLGLRLRGRDGSVEEWSEQPIVIE